MNDSERLARYLDDFGAQLVDATGSGARAPRPDGRRRRYALATVIALATIAVTTLVLGASGEPLDPVAEARAALAPPGEIVYMKITTETFSSRADSVPPTHTTEQWSATDPLRWRFVSNLSNASGSTAPARGRTGPAITRQELSYGAGVVRNYLAGPDTLVVTRGYRDDDPAARLPGGLGQGSGDVEADLRSMLLEGTVTDGGEQQLGGRTVRRFVVERPRATSGVRSTVVRLIYDVDPQTFAPIEGRLSLGFQPASDRVITMRLRVDAYKRIPLNTTTAKLLRIQTAAGTKATFDTRQQVLARVRAWRAKCRPIQRGRGLACPSVPGIAMSRLESDRPLAPKP